MDTNAIKNGTILPPPPVAAGNPEVMKVTSHFAQLAAEGKIIGVAMVGLSPDGAVHHFHVMPMVASFLQLTMGALSVLASDIGDIVKKERNKANVSPIIRPPTAMHG